MADVDGVAVDSSPMALWRIDRAGDSVDLAEDESVELCRAVRVTDGNGTNSGTWRDAI